MTCCSSFSGAANAEARTKLYVFMLSQFDDREKFETMAKLCSDVLGKVSEEQLAVTDETEGMIADTLKVDNRKNIFFFLFSLIFALKISDE